MKKLTVKCLAYLCLLLLFMGCDNDMDKYYARPDYLRGNAYEFLEEKGNYTYFLAALEKTGYKDALDGRGLYSVFAPDDEAFKKYMSRKGVSSLEGFNIDSLKSLISYHLIEFSFNKNDFLAFSKTASAEEPEVGDGSCYKFETLAQDGIKLMENPLTKREVKVFQQKKFLPVISTRLLRTQESSDYEADYKLFYPNIQWQGDKDHLYVANAAVKEAGIPLDNGYMYLINEVIEPLPSVYDALSASHKKGSYKIFRELYDRFAYMQYDAEKTKNYAELGDSLFMFYHYLPPRTGEDLPDIACQWTVAETEGDYEARLKYTFNCFAPDDRILEQYIRTFWEGQYNYQDVPLLNLYYLLKAHLANRQKLVLPSLIDKGLEGIYGEKWDLSRKNIQEAEFCTNGILYGVDKVLEPAMFNMVMQPFFKYGRLSTMLNIAHKQGTFITMVDPEREFTIFAIDDGLLKEKYGYTVDYYGRPTNPDVINGRVTIKKYISEKDHTLQEMNGESQTNFINNQVVDGYVETGLHIAGRKFYATKRPYHFIYTDNGQIYGEDRRAMNPVKTWNFEYPDAGGRGVVYEVDDKFKDNENNIGMQLFENSARYQKFYEALLNADLLKLLPEGVTSAADVTGVEMDWLKGERCMVFAPVNEAWDETQVPVDSVEQVNFLKFFFVPLTENKLSDYILPNYGVPGIFDTRHAYSPVVKAKMKIDFVDDKRLRISNEAGNSVLTDGEIPYFAKDGVLFGITSLIRAEN